ncbi:MAG: STM3941 family protein [Alphaproteobacteria bacterium]|nr:STM3941 family protein [Alphaproteobacteria bacterium]
MHVEFKERKFYTSKLKPFLPIAILSILYFLFEHLFMNNFSLIAYTSFYLICIALILFITDVFKSHPKFIINNQGMLFLSYKKTDIFVPWSDIERLKYTQFFFYKKLHVIVSNPQDYINKFQGYRKTILFKRLRHYHTPIIINFSNLKNNAEYVKTITEAYLNHFKPLVNT